MNPRFAAWLSTGADRTKLWLFFEFISGAKKYAFANGLGVEVESSKHYSQRWLKVTDHKLFDKACEAYASSLCA